MAQVEVQEESAKKPMEEITEEQFLKNLYLFMKKRDTPIERIPNLGFKQIDLFLMFKTVNDLGGYHQVTSHQLWKRVYNTLGGNPRSTSAATCTRRHYEKLLLPYECQLKGILMSPMPQHQSRPYRDPKDNPDQRPPKRGLLPLSPETHFFRSDPHGNIYPLTFPYYPTGWPAHPLLAPFVSIPPAVMPPHIPPPPKVPRLPSWGDQDPNHMVKGSLAHLRELAEKYKQSTEWSASQPLNLSTKAPAQEPDIDTDPPSSFGPPSSSKTPKFLNKPSTLYTPHSAGVVRSDGSETQESDEGVPNLSEPEDKKENRNIDVKAPTQSDSPIFISALMPEPNKGVLKMAPKSGSLKADFPVQSPKDGEARTEAEGFNLSHVLHRIPKDKEGKMEIEVPLSVVRNWLRFYGTSANLPEARELPVSYYQDSLRKKCMSDVDVLPTDYETSRSPQRESSAEDLRLRNKPGLMPVTQVDHHQDSHLTGCKTSGGLLRKVAGGRNVWPVDQEDINKPHKLNSTDFWDACSKETMAPRSPVKPESSPPRKSSNFYMEDLLQRGRQRLEVEPSAVLMLKSSPTSVFPLTTDEMMKLKNIISSSS